MLVKGLRMHLSEGWATMLLGRIYKTSWNKDTRMKKDLDHLVQTSINGAELEHFLNHLTTQVGCCQNMSKLIIKQE